MYKLYKHQKRVNGEWVDDDTVIPSIDANGTRKKVISFTSDASCYNGDVINERWVDDEIINADCNQKFDDYDDTKQEYLGCFDERTPSVTIKGEPNISYEILYYKINNPSTENSKLIRLDSSGNGYIEFESDDSIFSIKPSTESSTFEAEIKGCNVSGFGGLKLRTLTVSSSTYYRPNLDRVFNNCPDLSNIIFKGFDTSKTTTMSRMFKDLTLLTSVDVTHFDTSNVTNMGYMFSGCIGLTSLDLRNFNTSNVRNMGYMFFGCKCITSLDLSNFDTSNVTHMDDMFNGCSGLTSLNVSGWNTSKVIYMSYMFSNCMSLTSLDLSNFDTRNVTYMARMFQWCNRLTSLDLSGWDMTNVTDTKEMFKTCTSLRTIRMVGCNQTTIDKIKSALTSAGILSQVTIITE